MVINIMFDLYIVTNNIRKKLRCKIFSHYRLIMAKYFTSNNENIFNCKKCNFKCIKKGDWTRHILSLKHQRLHNLLPLHDTLSCECCGKTYKHHSSLSKHKKKCSLLMNVNNDLMLESQQAPVINDLMSKNNELLEKLIEVSGEKATTNNFNLNLYLNETCKDALNISEFIASLQIHLTDLNYLKDTGYSEGLTSIIVKELRDIDIHKRPVHCCDNKSDILYIKDKDVWARDNINNDKMKSAIQLVANKCVQNLTTWENSNPNYLESGTKDNDDYCVLIKNSIGSGEDKIKERDLNKIVKTVSTQVQIDKNKIDTS
jgi:hypothetical protein